MVDVDWDKITKEGAQTLLTELEKIPIYEVFGGRQRNSGENETIIRLRIFIANNDG